MSRFHSLLIDPAYLDFIDADSAELSLVRVSSADSFSKVPAQKHKISALPGSVMILPNDPGSIYEVRLLMDGKSVASGYFVMPNADHTLISQDLRTAWPIIYDQSFDLESRFLEKVDVSQLVDESTQRQSADAGLSARIDDVQSQISAIYTPGRNPPAVSNGTFDAGLLHYTGGTLNSFYGLNYAGLLFDHAASLRITGTEFDVWVDSSSSYTSGPYGSQDFMRVTAGASTLSAMHRDQNGLHMLTTLPYTAGSPVDVVFTATGLRIEHAGNVYQSPELDAPISYPKTKFLTAADTLVIDLQAAASGLLPDETAARIAGDEALADAIADVQTLAEVNQLNILEKADKSDLDTLQTVVTGQGLTLAQKADQTALDALTTVVSGKATPADITSAIAALVDGAPDALNTLAELATALAGEQAQISDLLTALALRVRVDAVQSLTLAQQLQARQNINAEAVGVAAGLVAAITPAGIGAATAVQGAKADTALQSADMAPVALSGQYSDLAGLPTIPGLSSSAPAAPTSTGAVGTATTVSRSDHAHPLPTSAQITAAVLTGLATGSNTAIAAADTLLAALAKLQAQASQNAAGVASNAALLAPVPRKVLSAWYASGRWYDSMYPYSSVISTSGANVGVLQFQRVFVIETVQVDQLAISVTGAVSGAGCIVGIYSDTGGSPASLIVKSGTIDCSSTGIKTFSISQTLTAGTTVWLAFLAVGVAGTMFRAVNTSYGVSFSGAANADEAAAGRMYITGQSDLPSSVTSTPVLSVATSTPRVMFRAV